MRTRIHLNQHIVTTRKFEAPATIPIQVPECPCRANIYVDTSHRLVNNGFLYAVCTQRNKTTNSGTKVTEDGGACIAHFAIIEISGTKTSSPNPNTPFDG